MPLSVEVEQEIDGRWLAEVPAVPGALAYGATRAEAVGRADTYRRTLRLGNLLVSDLVEEVGQ